MTSETLRNLAASFRAEAVKQDLKAAEAKAEGLQAKSGFLGSLSEEQQQALAMFGIATGVAVGYRNAALVLEKTAEIEEAK